MKLRLRHQNGHREAWWCRLRGCASGRHRRDRTGGCLRDAVASRCSGTWYPYLLGWGAG